MRLEDALRRTEIKDVAAYILKSSIYNNAVTELMKILSRNNSVALYVAANKGCEVYSELFAKIEGFYFLDVLPEDSIKPSEHMKGKCLGKVSPSSLSQISISIFNILEKKQGIKFLVFDSLSSLLIYNDYTTTMKFLRSLTGSIRSKGICTIYLALAEETDSKMRAELSQISDHVFDIDYI